MLLAKCLHCLSNLRITLIFLQYTGHSDTYMVSFHTFSISQFLKLQDPFIDSSLI